MGMRSWLVVCAVALVFGFAGSAVAGILLGDRFEGAVGAPGPAGPEGPPGPTGLQGPAGADADLTDVDRRVESLETQLQSLTGRISRIEIDGTLGNELELTEFGCHALNGVEVVTEVGTFYDRLQVEKSYICVAD